MLRLVFLQVTDEMDLCPPVSSLGLLFQKLLHPILPADGKPGADGLLDASGIIHLGGTHQNNLSRLPAGTQGGSRHPFPHHVQIFSNAHEIKPFLSRCLWRFLFL